MLGRVVDDLELRAPCREGWQITHEETTGGERKAGQRLASVTLVATVSVKRSACTNQAAAFFT